MHKNSQHSARDSEIVRVSVSLPIAATLYLLTRAARRTTFPRLFLVERPEPEAWGPSRQRSPRGGALNESWTLPAGRVHTGGRGSVGDASDRNTYRITARPQFRVKLAARRRRRAGSGGAERRSRNSVRARSCAFGSGAAVAVWPRARTRVASYTAALAAPLRVRVVVAAVADTELVECTVPRCAYFGREETPGRVGRAARALAAVLWWWCVALLRLAALCAPAPGPAAGSAARAREDAPSAPAAAAGAGPTAPPLTTRAPPPAPTPTPTPAATATATPPPAPDPPPHADAGWWWAGACVGGAALLCAAGALARPHLRRRAAALAASNPMLSVQVPGCAGMERLGAPGGPRHRHEHRHHHSTLEWEKQQRLQAMVGRLQEMVEQETRARSAAAAERLGLPPSIQLPDGEYGQDAHLQLRVPYQQAELTRSSFQPPPNKCVSDVPEWAGAECGPGRRGSGAGGGGGAGAAGGGAAAGGAGAAGKKDGLLQKATRWWVRMGARPPPPFLPASAPPPCVMVPRRAPPPPAPLPHPQPPDA